MGSIVKSIGKAIKKVGKGLKKVVKKIGPALLVAAAVYAGVAFYGAGSMAGGLGSLSTTNFSAGLTRIGQGISGFASGMFNPAGSATGMAGSSTGLARAVGPTAGSVANQLAGMSSVTGSAPGTLDSIAKARNLVAGSQGLTTAGASKDIISKWMSTANTPSSGMTTGDALAYMTKWNMIQTGLSAVAGIYGGKDAEKQAQLTREHEKSLFR